MRPQNQDSEIPAIFNHRKQYACRRICCCPPSPFSIYKVEVVVDVAAVTLLDAFCQKKLPFVNLGLYIFTLFAVCYMPGQPLLGRVHRQHCYGVEE